MNSKTKLYLAIISLSILGAGSASAANYADVAEATTALTNIPTTVSPVFLAFVTLAVGALSIRMIGRMAKKGASVA